MERPHGNRIELARNWCKGRVGMPFATKILRRPTLNAHERSQIAPSGDGSGGPSAFVRSLARQT